MATEINDQWSRKYDAIANTGPKERRDVASAFVIRIIKGPFRSFEFDGLFEMVDVSKPFDLHDDKLRAEVMLGWFDIKPKIIWTHITLDSDRELLRNWSDEVVHNLPH